MDDVIAEEILAFMRSGRQVRYEDYKLIPGIMRRVNTDDRQVKNTLRTMVRRKILISKRDAESNGPGQREPFRWYEEVR